MHHIGSLNYLLIGRTCSKLTFFSSLVEPDRLLDSICTCYAASMNRQLRRVQSKQDRKTDREKEKRRAARRERLSSIRRRRQRVRRKQGEEGTDITTPRPKRKGKLPGRFSGVLMGLTVVFIIMQAVVASPEPTTTINSVLSAAFFLLFGYFVYLWLKRRETDNAVVLSLLFGVLLAVGVTVAKNLSPAIAVDLLELVLTLPLLVLGVFLGRLVFMHSP